MWTAGSASCKLWASSCLRCCRCCPPRSARQAPLVDGLEVGADSTELSEVLMAEVGPVAPTERSAAQGDWQPPSAAASRISTTSTVERRSGREQAPRVSTRRPRSHRASPQASAEAVPTSNRHSGRDVSTTAAAAFAGAREDALPAYTPYEAAVLLSALPHESWSYRYIRDEDGGEGDAECRVCLSEYIPDEEIVRLPCMHYAHTRCLEAWLIRCPKCPICRTNAREALHALQS